MLVEYLQDLGRFLWAVVTNWAGLVTGGVIVALLWLWSTIKQVPVSRKVGVAIALLFLFLAVFNAWHEQYKKVRAMAAEVPDLRGWIDGVITGEMPLDSGGSVPMAFLVVSIKNLKAPSIAQGYECVARTPSGDSFQGQPQTVSADMKFQGAWGVKEFASLAPLYDKTAETPIERGAMRRGALLFTFPSAKSRFGLGSTFEIRYEDVLGKKGSAIVTVKGNDAAPLYYPGMQAPKK